MQIPTFFTVPVTSAIKGSTGLDMTLVKDKLIGAFAGTTSLSLGTIFALAYGLQSKGKQLAAEIKSKLQWQQQSEQYTSQLEADKDTLAKQSQATIDNIKKEKEAALGQVSQYKTQFETTAEALKKKEQEAEFYLKQNAANWQQAQPSNTLLVNPKTGAQILTVEKKVVV